MILESSFKRNLFFFKRISLFFHGFRVFQKAHMESGKGQISRERNETAGTRRTAIAIRKGSAVARDMERTFTYRITEKDAGQSVRSFLRLHGYSRHILSSMKVLPQAVLRNGQAVYMNHTLVTGDILTTTLRDPFFSANIIPAEVPFEIVYEDPDLLIVNKPAGIAIHPAINHPADTLANGIALYYKKKGIPYVFRCLNRLDRDTTGLLVLAKNALAASILGQYLHAREGHSSFLSSNHPSSDQPFFSSEEHQLPSDHQPLPYPKDSWNQGSSSQQSPPPDPKLARDQKTSCDHRSAGLFQRTYLAIVEGKPPAFETIDLPIGRKEGSLIERCIDPVHGSPAVTHFKVLQTLECEHAPDQMSVVELCLETGRTHQIRVHMSAAGYPLIGDSLYNPHPASAGLLNRQALHSWKLQLTHPITGKVLSFQAEIPEDLKLLLRQNH